MFNLFRLCRKDEISFDIVAETGNIVAKNGNNVEATFDIVDRIVQLVAFDNVARTLLLVWTGLKGFNILPVYSRVVWTGRVHGCTQVSFLPFVNTGVVAVVILDTHVDSLC